MEAKEQQMDIFKFLTYERISIIMHGNQNLFKTQEEKEEINMELEGALSVLNSNIQKMYNENSSVYSGN